MPIRIPSSWNCCLEIWCSWRTLFVSPNRCNAMCVSSEAAYVMRVGLSVGGEEQPSPSNRLHAAQF